MKKLAFTMAVVGALCSFTAFGEISTKRIGVETPFKILSKIEPNIMSIVISGRTEIRPMKIDGLSLAENNVEARLCLMYISGSWIWVYC